MSCVSVTLKEEECDHEGAVMSNRYGTFKLVDRREFSYRNFTTV